MGTSTDPGEVVLVGARTENAGHVSDTADMHRGSSWNSSTAPTINLHTLGLGQSSPFRSLGERLAVPFRCTVRAPSHGGPVCTGPQALEPPSHRG